MWIRIRIRNTGKKSGSGIRDEQPGSRIIFLRA
jgi:hypothetical protein